MTVTEQIKDSKYFLNLLKNKTDREEVRALTSAFLVISRSIPDHMLEEYDIKLKLNILLTDHLTVGEFKDKAKLQNNDTAIRFIGFYSNEKKHLFNNTIWNYLKNKRDIKIHRNDDPLRKHFGAKIEENINVNAVFNATVFDVHGNIKNKKLIDTEQNIVHSEENKIAPESIDNSTERVKWFFNDLPDIELLDLCSQGLNEMKNFVHKIENQFP